MFLHLACAGAFFTYTGAIVSHLTTGYSLGEVGLLAVLTALTALSWALRPPSRRTWRPTSTAAPAARAFTLSDAANQDPAVRSAHH